MRNLILFFSTIILFACGESVSSDNTTKKSQIEDAINSAQSDSLIITSNSVVTTVTDTLIQDTIIYTLNEEAEMLFSDSIAPYVSVVQLEEIKNAYFFSQGIRTSQDLYDYYTIRLPQVQSVVMDGMSKSHPDIVYSGDSGPADDWSFISKLFPELDAECLCAECDSEAHIRIDKMLEKAKLTSSTEDDDFFFFASKVYGPGWDGLDEHIEEEDAEYFNRIYDRHRPGWYVVDHCDICGYNTLGDNFYFKTLEYAFNKKWDMYQSEIESMVSAGELNDHQYNFYYKKEAVLNELEKLLILPLPDKFMTDIKTLRKRIEENREVHFGCQDINNNCPVG